MSISVSLKIAERSEAKSANKASRQNISIFIFDAKLRFAQPF